MTDVKYVCPGSRSTPPEFKQGDTVQNKYGRAWGYVEERDVWVIVDESEFGPDPSTARSWHNLMHHCGPFIRSLPAVFPAPQ